MDNNQKYGLELTDIDNIISVLKSNIKIEEIVLFGSRAKGNFKEGSDVDLALKGTNLGLKDILNASLEIDELFLPYKFDFVIYNRINETALIQHIDKFGKALYKS